jgi:hypothetical protein
MWLSLLPSKDCATTKIKRIQAAAERKSGNVLGTLRTDRGGEFSIDQFKKYCQELRIRRELTALYTPQQNGVVERQNQTIMGAVRCMLKAKNLPGLFWGEAVTCAVYLLNKTTSKSLDGKTSYEAWTGTTPVVHHLRTFGCIAHVKVNTPNLKKLADRSKKMIFVGYEPGLAAYRFYDPVSRRVHVSRDVIFDEEASWAWTADQAAGLEFDFAMAGESELIPTTEAKHWLGTPPVNTVAEAGSQATGGAHVQENEMENRGASAPSFRTPAMRSAVRSEAGI